MRTRPTLILLSLAAFAAAAGCGGTTGQSVVSFPATATGTAAAPFTVQGWSVTLTKAQVSFGPIYFCPVAGGAETNCSVAVVELLTVTPVDALDPTPQPLGEVEGTTGVVESATWDYGITWFTTEEHPTAQSGSVDGHSAHFEGTATKGAQTIQFAVDLDMPPHEVGVQAVNSQAVPTTPITPATDGLTVQMDPSSWWTDADINRIATLNTSGASVIVVPSGDSSMTGVVDALEANAPPTFAWGGS